MSKIYSSCSGLCTDSLCPPTQWNNLRSISSFCEDWAVCRYAILCFSSCPWQWLPFLGPIQSLLSLPGELFLPRVTVHPCAPGSPAGPLGGGGRWLFSPEHRFGGPIQCCFQFWFPNTWVMVPTWDSSSAWLDVMGLEKKSRWGNCTCLAWRKETKEGM